jgi:hypothetical protein
MDFSRYRGHVPELSCGGLTAGSATTGTVLSAITKEAMKRCSGQVNGEAGRSTAGLQRCAAIIMDGAAGERWLSHDIKDTFLQKGFPRAFYDPDEYQKLTPGCDRGVPRKATSTCLRARNRAAIPRS